jgi:hypothetical protein
MTGFRTSATPPFRCWLSSSSCCNASDWEKKEPQMTVPEVRAVLRHLLHLRRWDEEQILAWSNGHMERNRTTKLCHERRRRAELRRRSKKPKQALSLLPTPAKRRLSQRCRTGTGDPRRHPSSQ